MKVKFVSTGKMLLSLLFCLGTVIHAYAQELRFVTNVSSTRVAVDEPFQIQFMLENASNVSSFQPPSFKDFDILQGPSQMEGTSIVNGRRSEYIALIYVIQARRSGNYTLAGAVARVNGNMIRSNPVTIEVSRGQGSNAGAAPAPIPHSGGRNAEPDNMPEDVLRNGEDVNQKLRRNIFVKIDVDKTTLYEGEQLTATYKLYTRLQTNSAVTKVPAFKGFSAKDIELPNPPQATEERLNGQLYKVFTIRKTLLFPLQSGTLELDPVEVDNQVRLVKMVKGNTANRKRPRDIFDEFFGDNGKDPFSDPFFDDFFNRPEVAYEVVPYKTQSPVVKVTVKPLPIDTRPTSFNGAVGNFSMTATVDKNSLSTDDALTLKVNISGAGNVNLLNAPKIEVPAGFEKYDPKVSDNIEKNSNPLSGSRQFEFVLMPTEAGDKTIPPVEFSYFDATSGSYKTLRSAPFNIKVSAGKQVKKEREDFSLDKNELAPIRTGLQQWHKSTSFLIEKPWYWILLLLPVLGLLGLFFNRRRQEFALNNATQLKYRYANKVALKRLELAARYLKEGKDKAFYEETSRAVWGYLSHKLHIPFADLSKQIIQEHLAQRNINGQHTAQLFELLDTCEVALYTPMQNTKMQGTYQQAVEVISGLEKQLAATANV